MKKYSLLLLTLLCFTIQLAKAQDAPRPAPEIRGFNLSPDNVGAIANTVNLYTGDLSLPLNLISISGRNGLSVDVSISYNSNVQNQVDTWNLEAPAGILGLGWSMNIPKIVADTKQTGTREDDTYYLLEGGSSNRLIRTHSGSDASGSYYTYETKNYQFWRIRYYYDIAEITGSTVSGTGPNKWEITKEDGMKYVYGDKNSGRGTLQFGVRWENWIGNSSQTLGQSQLAIGWNLSEIVNLYGEKITYEYINVEQFVGSGSGQKHTEASYIKEIKDVIGRKVQFFYNEKQVQFYMEPHTEQAEPDAYQEVYEKKYLDHIDVIQEGGLKQLSVNFKYNALDFSGNKAKMLLGYIEERNNADQAQPGIQFDYFQTTTSNGYKGFLNKITYPTGGTVTYSYKTSNNTINRSNRQLTINAPPGFAEPKVWIGQDYVVVAWRAYNASDDSNPKEVKLYVYQWVGEWKEQYLQSIGSVRLVGELNPIVGNPFLDYMDFQVVLEDNFFGVLVPGASTYYNLWILSKTESARGNWTSYSRTVDCGPCAGTSWPCENTRPTLLSGENFIALAPFIDDSTRPSHLYTYQGNSWADVVLNQTSGNHFYTAGNNYFFSHNRVGTNGLAQMNFSYLSEDKKWVTKEWSNTLTFGVSNLVNNKSYWHGANSLMVAMANDNPEYAYRWDLTYTNFYRDSKDNNNNNLFGSLTDSDPVVIMNNSMIAIYGTLARYDGKFWYTNTIGHNHGGMTFFPFAYGDDYVVRSTEYVSSNNYKGGRKEFNPNQLQWNADYIMDGADRGSPFESAGINNYYFGNGFYYRQPNGNWIKKITFSDHSSRVVRSGYPAFGVSTSVYPYNLNDIRLFKNGEVSPPFYLSSSKLLESNTVFKSRGVGSQIVITYPSTISEFRLTSLLTISRVINDQILGSQADYPVSLITVNDGVKDTYTSFDYNFATAVMDPSGSVAQYNQVTVIPGSATVVVSGGGYTTAYGYTTTYFHNGLTATDIGVAFPDYFDTDLRWAGSSYRTRVFDKNNIVVSIANSNLVTTNKDFLNSDGTKVDAGFYVRPYRSNSTTDNLVTYTTQTFDQATGQLKTQHVGDNSNSDIAGTGILNEYVYWWEKYDPTRSKNILVGPIQTSRKVNGVYTESQVSRYKNWNASLISSTVPGAFDSYVWKGTGALPDAFTAWDVTTTPPTDWQYGGKVVAKDDYAGVVYESSAKGDIVSSTIWDQYKIRPMAVVGNASFNQVAYSGFEDNSQGNWSWSDGVLTTGSSKTGSRYLSLGNTGLTKSGLTTSQKYLISFWAKSSSGSIAIDGVGTVTINSPSAWTYYEYTVTGLSGINIKKNGATEVQLDELRLHPSRSLMKTFSYHPLYGVTSETNSNNETSYTEYDEWGRVKNILDENKNIIKTNTYYTKN